MIEPNQMDPIDAISASMPARELPADVDMQRRAAFLEALRSGRPLQITFAAAPLTSPDGEPYISPAVTHDMGEPVVLLSGD
jgi:hypothetical protein